MGTTEQNRPNAQKMVSIQPARPVDESEHMEQDRWTIFYPAYIDKKKTIPEGRRVAKASCCENPLPSEIMEVCDYLNLPAVLEADKCYPRDILARGRVRVMIKKADGNPVHLSINNRMKLWRVAAELIPKLQTRASGSGGSGGGGNNKKRG